MKTKSKVKKATVRSREFIAALKKAQWVIDRKSESPFDLTEVHFGKVSKIRATNKNQEIVIPFSADVERGFTILLDPRAIFTKLSGHDRPVDVSLDGANVVISDDVITFRTTTFDVDGPDLVEFRQGTTNDQFSISEAELHKALSAVKFATASEQGRTYLNGIFMTQHNGKMAVVATNGQVLCEYTLDKMHSGQSIVIPKGAISTLLRLISPKSADLLQISIYGPTPERDCNAKIPQNICIKHKNWAFKSNADGSGQGYPDYNKVIPKPSDNIRISALKESINRIPNEYSSVIFSPENGTAVAFSARRLAARDDKIEFTIDGHGESFQLSVPYLKKILAALGDFAISGSGRREPFLVMQCAEDSRIRCVLMPICFPR